MLRLYDARDGHVSDVLCARPGRLVIQVAPSADLRGQVLADTIRRLSERQRLRVFLFSDRAPADLNVRAGLSGEVSGADLSVGEISPRNDPGSPMVTVQLSSVRALDLGPSAGRLPTPAEVTARGLDPLALRLAILRRHYRDTLDVSFDDLAAGTAELAQWRAEVAGWARAPGRPMSAGYLAEAEAALCDDLDVAGALRVLRQLAADPSVEPGSKFESIVHLDLILALDLVADIGKA